MKVIAINDAKLTDCIRQAQRTEVVITRKGKPVAMIVALKGMDLEQVELGLSEKFWALVEQWRQQPTITHAELLKEMEEWDRQENSKPTRKKQKTS